MSPSIPRNTPQQLEKRDLSASFQLKPFGLFSLWLGGNQIFQLGLLTLMLPIIVIPFQNTELIFFGPKVSWILGLRSLLINQMEQILCRTDFLESPSLLYP